MLRLVGMLLCAFALLTPLNFASAQSGTEKPVQLRLTNTLTERVDYYLIIEGTYKSIGFIKPRSVVDIEARSGQQWMFGVNRKPFQTYTTRNELFQSLTIAPEDKRRPPIVANAYQPPIGGKQAAKSTADTAKTQVTTNTQAAAQEPEVTQDENGLSWFTMKFQDENGADNVQLLHAVPESDNVQFVATCSSEDGGINTEVFLPADVSQLPDGTKIKVRFVARGVDQTFTARVLKGSSGEGDQGALFNVPVDDPFWQALPKASAVNYRIATLPTIRMSLAGMSRPTGEFLRDCRLFKSAQPVAAAQTQSGGKDTCRAASNTKSTDGGKSVTVTIVNRTNEYRNIDWIDFNGQNVNYAGLNSGDSFSVQTSTTHPWMATDGPGNCIEIFLAKRDGSTIELSRASPGFGAEND